MKLPIELVYCIVDLCLEGDLRSCQDILKSKEELATTRLVCVNYGIYSYIIQNSRYNKLRLWKLLCHIPKQYKPIQLSVGISDECWTILEVEVRNERVGNGKYENFLVLEETTKAYSEPKKWNKSQFYLQQQQRYLKRSRLSNEYDDTVMIPYFSLYPFLNDLNIFTTNNLMSIWLWKRSNTFFKKDILINNFRPVLDTQQKSLMAWDRPILNKNGSLLGLTDNVLLYNTELFGRLL